MAKIDAKTKVQTSYNIGSAALEVFDDTMDETFKEYEELINIKEHPKVLQELQVLSITFIALKIAYKNLMSEYLALAEVEDMTTSNEVEING